MIKGCSHTADRLMHLLASCPIPHNYIDCGVGRVNAAVELEDGGLPRPSRPKRCPQKRRKKGEFFTVK